MEENKKDSESNILENDNAIPQQEPQDTPSAEHESSNSRDELLYLKAEFENFKKRLLREQENSIRYANERIIRDLLPIVDLFDKAIGYSEQFKQGNSSPELKSFIDGIQMTRNELTRALQQWGVEFIGTIGEPFDPVRHEAISQTESTEENEGKLVSVLQKGCLYNGRLLSPAKVIIGKVK